MHDTDVLCCVVWHATMDNKNKGDGSKQRRSRRLRKSRDRHRSPSTSSVESDTPGYGGNMDVSGVSHAHVDERGRILCSFCGFVAKNRRSTITHGRHCKGKKKNKDNKDKDKEDIQRATVNTRKEKEKEKNQESSSSESGISTEDHHKPIMRTSTRRTCECGRLCKSFAALRRHQKVCSVHLIAVGRFKVRMYTILYIYIYI